MLGNWLVTVEGEPETRTLVVSTETARDDGTALGARYGLTSRNQTPVEASVLRQGDRRRLVLTTQAASRISADEQADGSFAGTFTSKSGKAANVTIARVDDARLARLRTAAQPVPLAADVPKECASFHGNWTGNWTTGGTAVYLRVVEAKQSPEGKCVLRFSSSRNPAPVPALESVELASGRMIFTCNRSTNGTCVYARQGDVIEGSYSNPMGGRNSITLQRMP